MSKMGLFVKRHGEAMEATTGEYDQVTKVWGGLDIIAHFKEFGISRETFNDLFVSSYEFILHIFCNFSKIFLNL